MQRKRHEKKQRAFRSRFKPFARDIINFLETSMEHDLTDTLGSYTGRPSSDDETPEQDADDL